MDEELERVLNEMMDAAQDGEVDNAERIQVSKRVLEEIRKGCVAEYERNQVFRDGTDALRDMVEQHATDILNVPVTQAYADGMTGIVDVLGMSMAGAISRGLPAEVGSFVLDVLSKTAMSLHVIREQIIGRNGAPLSGDEAKSFEDISTGFYL